MREATKKTRNQVISDFLTSNKTILLTILSLIVFVIIIFGVISTLSTNKEEEIMNSTTKLDQLYEDLLSSDDNEEDFLAYANKLISDYKGSKAEVIAYSRLGSYYFDKENYEKANEYYTLAYTEFPNDIAASVYMFNSAMSLEELNKIDEAIAVLENIVSIYKSDNLDIADSSADVPEAVFNLGRLFEKKGDIEKAIEYYERLVAEYKSVSLSNLAKTRLITIKK